MNQLKRASFQQGFAFISVIVAVVLIGAITAVGYSAYTKNQKAAFNTSVETASTGSDSTATVSTTSDTDASLREDTTFLEVIARGENLECDWTTPNTENPMLGKLYTTAGKARSSATSSQAVAGMSIQADAVYKDNGVSGWLTMNGSVMPQGFKFTEAELKDMGDDLTEEQKQQGELYRQNMQFDCKPWSVDQTKFELPSGVTFE